MTQAPPTTGLLHVAPLSPPSLDAFARSVVALYATDPGPVPMTLPRARAQAQRLLQAPPAAWAFLLMVRDVAVGHLILVSFWSNEFGGPMLFVDEIHVHPEHRGQGLGAQALDWALDWARTRGFVRLELEVNRDNHRAMALYRRMGLVEEDREIMGRQIAPL